VGCAWGLLAYKCFGIVFGITCTNCFCCYCFLLLLHLVLAPLSPPPPLHLLVLVLLLLTHLREFRVIAQFVRQIGGGGCVRGAESQASYFGVGTEIGAGAGG